MIFALFAHLFSIVFDLLGMLGRSEREKDLEIAFLRQQIRVLQRTRACRPIFPGVRNCLWLCSR